MSAQVLNAVRVYDGRQTAINLMPSTRNWHDYRFYRADVGETHERIGALFKDTGTGI